MVNHEQLLDVLNEIGVHGIANKLFKPYLSDREQVVSVGSAVSAKRQLKCGVPRGTV